MANPKAETRLRPIMHAYITDLVKLGAYGKGKAGVIRRLIEAGIVQALEHQVIAKRDVRDHEEELEDDPDDEC